MKRSEMIQDIATFFLLDDKLDNVNWKEAQQKADTLLSLIEEKGIQPPINKNWEYIEASWTKDLPDVGYNIKYKWEPENEDDRS